MVAYKSATQSISSSLRPVIGIMEMSMCCERLRRSQPEERFRTASCRFGSTRIEGKEQVSIYVPEREARLPLFVSVPSKVRRR